MSERTKELKRQKKYQEYIKKVGIKKDTLTYAQHTANTQRDKDLSPLRGYGELSESDKQEVDKILRRRK